MQGSEPPPPGPTPAGGMTPPEWPRPRLTVGEIVFLGVLALLLVLLYLTLASVLTAVVAAAVLAVLTQRPYRWLAKKLGERPRAAAVIATLAVAVLIMVPVGFAGYLLVNELANIVSTVHHATTKAAAATASRLPGHFVAVIRWISHERNAVIGELGVIAPKIVQHTAEFIGLGAIMLVTLFTMYLYGESWWEQFLRLVPLEERYLQDFGAEFRTVVFGVLFGLFLTALAHGAAAAIGYWIFGVHQVLLWGVLTFFAAFVPIVGTGLVWIPLGVWMIIDGRLWHGIGLLAYGVVVMGALEYLLRPYLMKGASRVPDVLVLLSLIGGISEFGMSGLFEGPLVAALALVALRIWKRDFRPRFPPEPPPEILTPAGAPVAPPANPERIVAPGEPEPA